MVACIIVVNAGSSSIKFSVFTVEGTPTVLLRGGVSHIQHYPKLEVQDATGAHIYSEILKEADYQGALKCLLAWLKASYPKNSVIAIGHRVVHGGAEFFAPVVVTPKILQALHSLIPLAPLHQPYNVQAIEIAATVFPAIPQIACFDTAYHSTRPWQEKQMALPAAYSKDNLINYGFHGLSYEYIASVLPTYLGTKAQGKILVAHLGNGASMCAIEKLKSVATTMGFSTLEGLMMGTRCGSIDPGVLLYLLEEKRLTVNALRELLYYESGLKGVSGISADMQVLLESQDPKAAEAIDLFCYHAAGHAAKLVAAMQGIDALIFTAGIGEHAPLIRQKICDRLGWLGICLEKDTNAGNYGKLGKISAGDSRVEAYVIPTHEEYVIALQTKQRIHNV
jgi:acetate kinase